MSRTTQQIKTAATLMGMGVGFVLERKWVGFESGGIWWKRALRLMLGLGLMLGLREGLGVLASGMNHESVFRFVRYLLLGLGGALIAPWIFVSIGLAKRKGETP